DVRLFECDLFENLVEGFSIAGPADVRGSGTLFRDNGAEGMDANDWVAPAGVTLDIHLSDCAFLRNGTEGLDLDLTAPSSGGSLGGRFELELVDCDFENNADAGLLIDLEYEASPAWQARLELRGLRARNNGGSGVHLDLDGPATTLVHRLASSANLGHGILVTSESQVGVATLSASALLGNGGAGARSALGNVGLAVSHCVFSGNLGGGVRGDGVMALAHSSVAYLQPAAWQGTLVQRGVELEFPTPPAFLHMPFEIRRITGMQQGMWSLDGPAGFGPQTLCEVDNDGVLRTATNVGPSSVSLDPAPGAAAHLLFAFPPSDTVGENYTPTPGSPLLGAGIIPPAAPATDAGPMGAAFGGAPGEELLIPPSLFYLAAMSPPWGTDLADGGELSLRFEGGVPDFSSAAAAIALVPLGSQQSIPVSVVVVGDELRITPLETLPQGPVVLELHAQLRSLAGLELAASVVLPVRSGN
ncbi:MAG: hypothetical protein ACI8QC_002237, partial [Planctomycetota bacterium]